MVGGGGCSENTAAGGVVAKTVCPEVVDWVRAIGSFPTFLSRRNKIAVSSLQIVAAWPGVLE